MQPGLAGDLWSILGRRCGWALRTWGASQVCWTPRLPLEPVGRITCNDSGPGQCDMCHDGMLSGCTHVWAEAPGANALLGAACMH